MLQIRLPKGMFASPEASRWTVVSFALGVLGFWYLSTRASRLREGSSSPGDRDAVTTDPGLLKKGTSYESYTTRSGYTYPRIRTFYHPHPKAGSVPNNLPLLVFMHGLGGSAAQFAPLMTSLVNIAPCLAIDLPGCGLSDFKPDEVAAYTAPAFAELLYAAIDRFRDKEVDQKVVLVGHSMGCSVASLLASSTSPLAHLCSNFIVGLIAICPRSSALSTHDLTALKRMTWVPSRLFDLIRLADRRGGVDSVSVMRVVGHGADLETRKLQLRFNEQSKSPVFQRFCQAIHLQETSTASAGQGSLISRRTWAGVRVPLFLVAAESDKLAPPREVEQITGWLTHPEVASSSDVKELSSKSSIPASEKDSASQDIDSKDTSANQIRPFAVNEQEVGPAGVTSVEAEVVPTTMDTIAGEAVTLPLDVPSQATRLNDAHPGSSALPSTAMHQRLSGRSLILKTSIFPAPASHGLLYATSDARILSGLIENFLTKYVDVRLSPGWQLQHLTTSGKWDVKNLKKWQSVEPCSEPISGVFRAMKTMREVDDQHCPREFVKAFSDKAIPDGVAMIVDISHETPVYDKAGLEEAGVEYHKFPTVSKLPPTADEVGKFIALIDGLRQSPRIQQASPAKEGTHPTIGVHCHYGFNRTGFFIVCYLVERLGYTLQGAVEEFAAKRPPGIKHEYFVNELFVRYAVKMERRGTVVA